MLSKYSKYWFNVFLKVWTDGDFLISVGNLLQTIITDDKGLRQELTSPDQIMSSY